MARYKYTPDSSQRLVKPVSISAEWIRTIAHSFIYYGPILPTDAAFFLLSMLLFFFTSKWSNPYVRSQRLAQNQPLQDEAQKLSLDIFFLKVVDLHTINGRQCVGENK
jgi:hypothetical protein